MATEGCGPLAEARRIREQAATLGVELEAAAVDRLVRYLDELELWNTRTNLVGEHDRRVLVDRHIVDALAAVPLLRGVGPDLRIADVGSGAGLPGVPLAIALEPREMRLIEPRHKRASFLRSVRRVLPEVHLEVSEERAEHVADRPPLARSFDAVVSRATLGDADLLSCAARLLRDGGVLIAYRGGDSTPHAATGSGFTPPVSHRYVLTEARRSFRLDVWTRCFT